MNQWIDNRRRLCSINSRNKARCRIEIDIDLTQPTKIRIIKVLVMAIEKQLYKSQICKGDLMHLVGHSKTFSNVNISSIAIKEYLGKLQLHEKLLLDIQQVTYL